VLGIGIVDLAPLHSPVCELNRLRFRCGTDLYTMMDRISPVEQFRFVTPTYRMVDV
jgi:hypothetical protein